MDKLIEIINQMKSSSIFNYVIAGLDSHLLENGTVRLFTNSRKHQNQITPHSHRFDFACLVLQGEVTNKKWFQCSKHQGDFFQLSKLDYNGDIGFHEVFKDSRNYYSYTKETF